MTNNNTDFEYVGDELEIFEHALRWKRYWGKKVKPYLGKDVLEVGAGLGGTTAVLCSETFNSWTGIEPDRNLLNILNQRKEQGEFPANCTFREATIQILEEHDRFDSILYIDVLEHIEADQQEIATAAQYLRPGGFLIVLSPAFPVLYTPFDEAIGHFRRYTRQSLRQLTPSALHLVQLQYLDTVGMLASITNRLFLREAHPSLAQILFWDRYMVPLSRMADVLLCYSFGRSILGVWERV